MRYAVARLVDSGFLEMVPAKRDRRVRILTPTERMYAQDLDWLAAHYLPLHVLFPDSGYAPMVQRDRSFQLAQRLVSTDFFGRGANILASNPGIYRDIGTRFDDKQKGVQTGLAVTPGVMRPNGGFASVSRDIRSNLPALM
jgi:hypothetical protein